MKKKLNDLFLCFVIIMILPMMIMSCENSNPSDIPDGETPTAPVISNFTASPVDITSAQDVILNWTVTGADDLTIDNAVGSVTGLSNTTVHVAATTTYTLTATNSKGSVTAQATVNLVPPGTVFTPIISPAAGSYVENVFVTITCSTDDADIYYTIDGSIPTEDSTLYTASFDISTIGITVVRAIAVKNEMTDSAMASSQYTITEPVESGKYVADYTVAKDSVLRAIPDNYINTARTTLHVAYNHTSHGTHVSYGVFGLPGFKAGDSTKFGVTRNTTADPNKLDFRDNQISGAYSDLSQADANWETWRNQVRAYLDNATNSSINVMMWSWCDILNHSVPNYLSSMQTLIDEYGQGGSKIGSGEGKTRTTPVTFIFMTGHANGSANIGNGRPKDQAKLITDYCIANEYYCIDYYSIDSHAMNDTYYEDVNDNGYSPLYGGNFYQDWQVAHTLGTDWYENRTSPGGSVSYGQHNTQHITANRKAFAFWWVLARIAGNP